MLTAMETERLVIEPITLNDNLFILELLNTEGWIKFIGDRNVHSPEDATQYIQRILNNPKFNYFVFRLKENNIPIGLVTFLQRDDLDYPDIGFAMLPAYSKKGFSYEASKKVMDEIINSGKHEKVLAITLKDNYQSIRLLEKLGLSREGEKIKDG
ncbi:MAG: GNAT family N-acetyltransferase [Sphingobacteriales bacterium]|nr:GNAT family N-acetyltransferase [Sphingobacteriales bacterium]